MPWRFILLHGHERSHDLTIMTKLYTTTFFDVNTVAFLSADFGSLICYFFANCLISHSFGVVSFPSLFFTIDCSDKPTLCIINRIWPPHGNPVFFLSRLLVEFSDTSGELRR
jgi:hypothetical protein